MTPNTSNIPNSIYNLYIVPKRYFLKVYASLRSPKKVLEVLALGLTFAGLIENSRFQKGDNLKPPLGESPMKPALMGSHEASPYGFPLYIFIFVRIIHTHTTVTLTTELKE